MPERLRHTALLFLFLLLFRPLYTMAAEKPNVLFVVTDDQRFDTIAALGHQEVKTPTLDALVKRGFSFGNCYCMGSMVPAVCAPSRAMLMTGKSLWRIPEPRAKSYAGPTLGRFFRDAGYQTLFCGKRGNTFVYGNEQFETVVYDRSVEKRNGGRANASQFMADSTIDWLNRTDKPGSDARPFFIYLGPPVPHDPREAPAQFHQLYDPEKITLPASFLPAHPFDNGELSVRDEMLAAHPRTPAEMKQHLADYYACITCFDYHLGRVLEALRQRDQLKNTLIVFTSDHGLAVGGMHGLMGKQNLYEHNRAPLLLAGPGIPAGKQSEALVYLFDLFPTVADAVGLPEPEGVEGKSLLPIVRGKRPTVRDVLLGAYRNCQRMVRDDRWKLIEYRVGKQHHSQLFDLQQDPSELANLAADPRYRDELKRMKQLLASRQTRFGDPMAAP